MAHSTLLQRLLVLSLFFVSLSGVKASASDFSSYDNAWVDPDYVLSKNISAFTSGAQATIFTWAKDLANQGPWSVLNKTVVAPSGDKHDYLSWAPYSWPNCTGVGNTTQLTPEQVWTTCPYYTRDGMFNPDRLLVNDTGHFSALADAVLYNSIAWALNGQSSSQYSRTAAFFLYTWFINPDTKMNPNLNYAQLARGPKGQVGQHTGVLDLKTFTKIVSGILILRNGRSSDWTSDLDNGMIQWANQYIPWLENNPIALGEATATNNHGSYYYNQLAALKLLINDTAGAKNVTDTYFSHQYLGQINANGEQPLEAVRTRPFHYRCYNLAAMITNGLLAIYADPSADPWNLKTNAGGTIKAALDFTMTVNPAVSNETDMIPELWPNVAAVASLYGDPDGEYASFLKKQEPDYANDAYFFWTQPLASGAASQNNGGSSGTGSGTGAGTVNKENNAIRIIQRQSTGWLTLLLAVLISSFLI